MFHPRRLLDLVPTRPICLPWFCLEIPTHRSAHKTTKWCTTLLLDAGPHSQTLKCSLVPSCRPCSHKLESAVLCASPIICYLWFRPLILTSVGLPLCLLR
uniref:Uncharacterized protein n=1 Tax=Kalanchoe fedtschenkoi TaxID=63787 RepID=A0A7N0TKM8_KALFE